MALENRQTVVSTAQIWFDESRRAQKAGLLREAVIYMENAFNHTENALAAVLRAAVLKDEPPVTGRPAVTLAEFRSKLDELSSVRGGD